MDEFETIGEWWLPHNMDNRKLGRLTFSHTDGLSLEVYGSFSFDATKHKIDERTGIERGYPLIEGITRNGKRFSIFGCSFDGISASLPGFSSETFRGSYAFENQHKEPEKAVATAFNKAHVQFTYLPDWVGFSGIQETFSFNKDTKVIDKIEIVYTSVNKIMTDLEDSTVLIAQGYSKRGNSLTGVSLEPVIWLEIEADSETNLKSWLENFIVPLQELMTLATQQQNAITFLSLFSEQNRIQTSNGFRESATKVYYQQSVAKNKRKSKILNDYAMLFSFQDIQRELDTILKNWLSIRRKELKSSLDLFFGVEMSNGMYLDNEFLNLAQALEVYHRERFDNTVVPKADFKIKKKEIIESVPENYREWLQQQLAHSNEPRLFHRVIELVEHTTEVLARLVEDTEGFARKVTDTRNFLTHYSRKSKHVMENEELFRAVQTLSYILQACMLFELGLSREHCLKLFNRNQKYLFTSSQIKQHKYWKKADLETS